MCEVKQKDQYGRSVAACAAGSTKDVGKWMVANGEVLKDIFWLYQ
jgi:endonuclease YncB( thermonuclease family)